MELLSLFLAWLSVAFPLLGLNSCSFGLFKHQKRTTDWKVTALFLKLYAKNCRNKTKTHLIAFRIGFSFFKLNFRAGRFFRVFFSFIPEVLSFSLAARPTHTCHLIIFQCSCFDCGHSMRMNSCHSFFFATLSSTHYTTLMLKCS